MYIPEIPFSEPDYQAALPMLKTVVWAPAWRDAFFVDDIQDFEQAASIFALWTLNAWNTIVFYLCVSDTRALEWFDRDGQLRLGENIVDVPDFEV